MTDKTDLETKRRKYHALWEASQYRDLTDEEEKWLARLEKELDEANGAEEK